MKRMLFVLIAFAVLAFIVIFSTSKNQSPTTPKEETKTYETQESSEGAVTVEVTPIKLSNEGNVVFKVVLNTHSVELTADLKDTSLIIDDKGKEYKPISWDGGEGPPARSPTRRVSDSERRASGPEGGHHLSGNLTFPSLTKNPKSVKLIIKGIGEIDRIFIWDF